MKLTKILILTAAFSSITALAGEHFFDIADDVQRAIENNKDRTEFLNNSKEDYENHALAIHRSIYSGQVDAKKAEELLKELMEENGKYKFEKGHVAKYLKNDVIINDKLFDLDRMSVGSVSYKTVKVKYTNQLDPDSDKIKVDNNYSSDKLMRMGKAPIGPDSKPIRLCRLVNVPDATFFELSHNESVAFINGSLSGMPLDRACILHPDLNSRYWRSRRGDFYYDSGERKRMTSK